MIEFRFKLHWNLFPGFQLIISSIGSGNGLAPTRPQAITWPNADPVHLRIYAALGGDELSISWQEFNLCLQAVKDNSNSNSIGLNINCLEVNL